MVVLSTGCRTKLHCRRMARTIGRSHDLVFGVWINCYIIHCCIGTTVPSNGNHFDRIIFNKNGIVYKHMTDHIACIGKRTVVEVPYMNGRAQSLLGKLNCRRTATRCAVVNKMSKRQRMYSYCLC